MDDLQLKSTAANVQNPPIVLVVKPVIRKTLPRSAAVLEIKNKLQLRSEICRFLIRSLGWSMACCFMLIILQGFHAWGFRMSESLLRWVCGATIGQGLALFSVFVKEVWGTGHRKPPKCTS
jgi:hypothetical protein